MRSATFNGIVVNDSDYYGDTGFTLKLSDGTIIRKGFTPNHSGLHRGNFLDRVSLMLSLLSSIGGIEIEVSKMVYDFLFPEPVKTEAELKIEAAEKLLVEAKELLKK